MDEPLPVNRRLGGGPHIQACIQNLANFINMYSARVHRGSMPHFETLTPSHPLRTIFQISCFYPLTSRFHSDGRPLPGNQRIGGGSHIQAYIRKMVNVINTDFQRNSSVYE